MDNLAVKNQIARFPFYVTDFSWWPNRNSGGVSTYGMTVGEHLMQRNPQLEAIIYWHSAIYEWNQAERGGNFWKAGEWPGQVPTTGYLVDGVRYRQCLEWLATRPGSTSLLSAPASVTGIRVESVSPFHVGDHVLIGDGPVELATITAIDAEYRWLTVKRGEQAQDGRYPARDWAEGTAIRPVLYAFGDPQYMLVNVTDTCPLADGGFGPQTSNEWMASFLAVKLAEPEFQNLKGVFLDNFLGDPVQLFPAGSQPFTAPQWQAGMRDLVSRLRAALGPEKVIVANTGGDPAVFGPYLDGFMIEGVDASGNNQLIGGPVLERYLEQSATGTYTIFNASAAQNDLAAMRYLFGLCLLGDGIFVYDEFLAGNPEAGLNSGGHQTVWWYPEYDLTLGRALGPATQRMPGYWVRTFERGAVEVDTTLRESTITLHP